MRGLSSFALLIAVASPLWITCEYPHHGTDRHKRCVISLPGVGAIVRSRAGARARRGFASNGNRGAKDRVARGDIVDGVADWGFLANKGTAPNECLDRIRSRNGDRRGGPDAVGLLDRWRDLPGVAADRLFMCCSVIGAQEQDITMRPPRPGAACRCHSSLLVTAIHGIEGDI
jgi:hypothetical protein